MTQNVFFFFTIIYRITEDLQGTPKPTIEIFIIINSLFSHFFPILLVFDLQARRSLSP